MGGVGGRTVAVEGVLAVGDADGDAVEVLEASQAVTGEEEGARGTTDSAAGEALLLELPYLDVCVGVHDVPPIREYVAGH